MGLCLVNDIPSKWDDISCWDTRKFNLKEKATLPLPGGMVDNNFSFMDPT